MYKQGFGVSSPMSLQARKDAVVGEPMPGVSYPFGTRVKTFSFATVNITGTINPGTTSLFAILKNPKVAITELPQGGSLQYYVAFYTFIDGNAAYQHGTFLQFHIYLEDADGIPLYKMDCDLRVSVSCDMRNFYFFDQQAMPPNFFDITENAKFHLDASSGWHFCP